MSSYNFQIEMQCPQCGAPVVLEETEYIIQCRFCRTRNIVHTLPYPCYYIEPRQKKYEALELTYVPYWRFKGLEFSLGAKKPGFRVVDHSYLALEKKGLPLSLGLRSQTQKLKFIGREVLKSSLLPGITRKDILKQIAGGGDKKIHIGEILSLIFMPFYQDADTFYDGVSGGITGKTAARETSLLHKDAPKNETSPAYVQEFSPGLCPNCGWDLKGETDSLVLHCSNCASFWLIHNRELNKFKTLFYDTGPGADLLMPFFRLQVEFQALDCSSYADLIRIANYPKIVTKEDEKQPLYFYIPAFKISPKLFLRIARQTTLGQVQPDPGQLQCNTKIFKSLFHPADLPLKEGFQAVLPILMDLCIHKKEVWDLLAKERLKLKSSSLIYIGFRTSGSEAIQDTLGFSLPISMIKFGRQL